MTDLFSGQEAPLADRMRPRTLAEFIGQRHLLGEGRLLRRAIEADRLTSSIFFGPPGCGKTTLASIIANSTKSAFVQLNAVTSGVADVRKVIADAQERRAYGQSTYLLLDECHRWSKAQSITSSATGVRAQVFIRSLMSLAISFGMAVARTLYFVCFVSSSTTVP